MRIEIFANGSGSVTQLQNGLSSMRSRISDTIEELRSANRKLANLPGGLGNLTDAYTLVQSRITKEEGRLAAAVRVEKASSDFLGNAIQTDIRVSRLVTENRERFFNSHPWLRPVVEEEKSWWQQRIEDLQNWWGSVSETLQNAWNSIVNWVKEHAVQIIIGVVAVVIGAAIAALTGGAAVPFLAAFGTALIGGLKAAAVSAVISGAISAALSAIRGKDVLSSFGDGFASGFMLGGIFYAAGNIFTAIKNIATSLKTQKTYSREVLNSLKSDYATDRAVEHIFEGQINAKGKAVGYHYNMIKGTKGSIIKGTERTYLKGIYDAKVSVSGVLKSGNEGYSTFFPNHMSPQDVWNAINEAFLNKTLLYDNVWQGTSKSGMEIILYCTKNGQKFLDAFPSIPLPIHYFTNAL